MTEDEIKAIQSEVRTWSPQGIKKDRTLNKKLESYHLQIFGKKADCINCINKIDKAIWKILNLKSQQILSMSTKYRVKKVNGKDQMITNNHTVPGVPIHVTNANLTDEIAELLLHSNFARFIEHAGEPFDPQPKKEISMNPVRTMVDKVPVNPSLQALLDSKTRQQLVEMLTAKKIAFAPKANKNELAELFLKS